MSYRRTNDAIRSNSLGNLVNEIATHAHNDYNSDEVPHAIHAWIECGLLVEVEASDSENMSH